MKTKIKQFFAGEIALVAAVVISSSAWAEPDAPVTPKVQLGVVAQRYPWNGTIDIEYKTSNATNVTFSAIVVTNAITNKTEIGSVQVTKGQSGTASFDLNEVADGAFKGKQLKDVKITATVE